MSVDERLLSRLDELITKADQVLATHEPNPPNVIGFPTLDNAAFTWSPPDNGRSALGSQWVVHNTAEAETAERWRDELSAGRLPRSTENGL